MFLLPVIELQFHNSSLVMSLNIFIPNYLIPMPLHYYNSESSFLWFKDFLPDICPTLIFSIPFVQCGKRLLCHHTVQLHSSWNINRTFWRLNRADVNMNMWVRHLSTAHDRTDNSLCGIGSPRLAGWPNMWPLCVCRHLKKVGQAYHLDNFIQNWK